MFESAADSAGLAAAGSKDSSRDQQKHSGRATDSPQDTDGGEDAPTRMTKNEVAKPLDDGLLKQLARQVDEGKKDTNSGVWKICAALFECHEHFAGVGREGRFSKWVRENCNYSRSAAYGFVTAWKQFGKKCPIRLDTSAIFLLANCPKAAQKASQLSEIGKPVDRKKALELRKESGEEPKPRKRKPPGPKVETAESEPACGYEPEEAKKPLRQLDESLKKAARAWADCRKILGESEHLAAIHDGLNQASKALDRLRRAG